MSAILSFIGAIPSIISMFKELMGWINKVSGNDPAGLAKEVASAFQALSESNTQAERQAAAQAIADMVTKL